MAHVGTRGSRLARAQTGWVIERLRMAVPDRRWLEVLISTTGDRSASVALGTGVFVKEVQQAVLRGAGLSVIVVDLSPLGREREAATTRAS